MSRQIIILLVAAFLTTTYGRSTVSSGLPLDLGDLKNVHYEGGVPWMLIPDDNGVPHIAILTEISPPVTRNVATDVRLNLFTRSNPTTAFRLQVNNTNNLANSGFDCRNPTKILIHGYTGNGQARVIVGTRNAYLATGSFNVIGVDWGVLATAPNYAAAAANTRVVGAHVADLIEFLVRQTCATLADFHLIGHSLGAHLAGFAGKNIRTGRVGRITGLDPANPLFTGGASGRLASGDATLVDTIVTDGDGLGLLNPIGDVNFYPNGGRRVQPGCGIFDIGGVCSHSRCVDFFIHSIRNPDAFRSRFCLSLTQAVNSRCTGVSTAYMGDRIRFGRTGIFHVDTRGVNV